MKLVVPLLPSALGQGGAAMLSSGRELLLNPHTIPYHVICGEVFFLL